MVQKEGKDIYMINFLDHEVFTKTDIAKGEFLVEYNGTSIKTFSFES